MHARVVTSQVSAGKLDEAIKIWKDAVMPAVKSQKGFKNSKLLANRKTGKLMTVALWDSEAEMQATAGAFVQEQLAKFGSLFSAAPVVEEFEVAAEV
jgi:heme-degrading monooxygenase HmoA